MNVTPEFAFDVCYEVYQKIWENCSVQCGVKALDTTTFSDHKWMPDRQTGPREYLEDFAIAGKRALEARQKYSRAVMFNMFHVSQTRYEHVMFELGISEMGFAVWQDEIKEIVGRELLRREIFPPRRYFHGNGNGHRPRIKKVLANDLTHRL